MTFVFPTKREKKKQLRQRKQDTMMMTMPFTRRLLSSSRNNRATTTIASVIFPSSRYLCSTFTDDEDDQENIRRKLEASFERVLHSPTLLERLFSKGYAVIENEGFDASIGRELRREIDALPLERFVPNSTRFIKDGTQTELVKKNIREVSAPFEEVDGRYLNALQKDRTMLTLMNVLKPSETPSEMLFNVSLKLQINDGENARFPIHFDSDSSTDQRRWTCLVYLNDEWEEKDGGEVVLYLPFQEEKRIVVPPKMGTVVMFNSRYVAHSTLPFKGKRRLMFTIWLHAKGGMDNGNAEKKTTAEMEKESNTSSKSVEMDAQEQLEKLLAPEQRKHLMKLMLAEEWAESIAEAHDRASESTARALKTHWEEIDIIARVLGQAFPLAFERLEKLIKSGEISDFPLKF
jgi:Rps23 Pro-64 3,4-dihydroxylase Tpa1-like proline 4-hydroxylase